MQTVHQTRRDRLALLKAKHGTWAKLNIAIGEAPTSSRLSQIANATLRAGRGTPFVMGDGLARRIEKSLDLPEGFMDTPVLPSAAEFILGIFKTLDETAQQRIAAIVAAFAGASTPQQPPMQRLPGGKDHSPSMRLQ